MSTVAIIQARMGSTRLPNKMMLWLCGFPIVGLVSFRVRQSQLLDKVVFALPDTPADDVLARYLQQQGELVYRGSEHDVLGRYYAAASLYNADTIVRICADNPLVSSTEIDRIVQYYYNGEYDYAYNHIPRYNNYPDGLGAEVVSFTTLEFLYHESTSAGDREHPFNYLWNHAHLFRIGTCDPLDIRLAHPELKLDIDNFYDYDRLLGLNVTPDSTAQEIVEAALAHSNLFSN